ncbi:MAG TPA: TonB family protein [Pyrinomonadaceae bacterium]|jgi:TonB family protein
MPRTPKLSLAVFALLSLCAPAALARQGSPDPQLGQAVALYQKGDVKGAVREFRAAARRRPDDPLAWSYLGQALAQVGEVKEARKALDAALKINPDYALAHSSLAYLHLVSGSERDAESEAAKALALDNNLKNAHYVLGLVRLRQGAWLKALEEAEAVIKLDANHADAYSLKTQALLGLYERASALLAEERRGAYDYDEATIREARETQPLRLREATESLAAYLRLRPDAEDAAEMREELESMRFYAETGASSADPARKVYSTRDGIKLAVILARPEPGYTEEARRANVSGVVRLRVVLGSDGKVRHVLPLRRLSHGLTEKAVEAARQVRFKPATLDDRPVSQYVVLEYRFNLLDRGIIRGFRRY